MLNKLYHIVEKLYTLQTITDGSLTKQKKEKE